ncbi:MAG TPA: FUSC family protein [Bryobacteraceae bacterium]|nr:FUSC family protein [Bryobacteraceae bacterium]
MSSGLDAAAARRGDASSPSAPREAPPGAWTAFWQGALRFDAAKINPQLAVRNTLGVIVPLAAGVAFDSVSAGLVAATGALNVCFSDSQEPYRLRARRMLSASLLVAGAVFAGGLSGADPWIAATVAGGWAFAAGMLVSLSVAAADLGSVSLVTLVVFMAVGVPPHQAAAAGALALGGGVLQTMLALAFWPVRPYAPERQALGQLYEELARMAAAPAAAGAGPPATAEITHAHAALAALNYDHSIEGERYRLLLSQAERIRIGLLLLARLRSRMERESPEAAEPAILARYFDACAGTLARVGVSLVSGDPAGGAPDSLGAAAGVAEELRATPPPPAPALEAMHADAQLQMDALTGQLRAAVDLAAYATPAGLAAFERRESERRPRFRLRGTAATLRSNLTLESAACRHAVRLAVCVGCGTALARGLHLGRAYWLPMTIAIVLKPEFTATFSRGVLRLAGTAAGLVLATALFHLATPAAGAEVALIAALLFILRCVGGANYGIFSLFLTALVVTLVALSGVAPKDVIAARGLNTGLGGIIALGAYWLWPTWERTQAPEALARMLDAFRAYFRALRGAYENPESGAAPALERTRAAGRLARTNLEASVERLWTEPGASDAKVSAFAGMLASSHRLAYAMMALEAGLAGSHPVPARPAFRRFADDVELTMYHAAAALRGSSMTAASLPDLRADHRALAHSGDSLTERYALVNVETDRITNSLNTLAEQILRWRAAGPA